MTGRWIPLLLLLVAGCARQAPDPEFPAPERLPAVQAKLSTETPKLGEVIDAHIRVTADRRVVTPPVEDWLHPEFRVLEQSAETTETETAWRRDLRLKLGLYSVTNITLFAESSVSTLSEPRETLDLPRLAVNATPVLEDETADAKFGRDELPDFRGPEAIRRRNRNLLISLAALLALAALIAFLFRRWSRRPKPPPPPIARDRIALREMEELRNSDVWKQPDVDACAVRLSRILRRYIEGRFGIDAPELTTEEFLREAGERKPWSEDRQAGLSEFFAVTDRIKYAAERPGRGVLADLMTAAGEFVKATARPPGEESA